MTRVLTAALLVLAAVCEALGGGLTFGPSSGNRVRGGVGRFPRWQALSLSTDLPVRWLVALGERRLAAVQQDGTLLVLEIAPGGLRLIARYGEVAGPDSPPVAVRLDQERVGVGLVGPGGRLLLWSDDGFFGYDVGAPLSRSTFPVPVAREGRAGQDLLAVAQDGAVLLIGGLAGGAPRVVARVDVHALADARITLADLDGDGAPEAVVLSDPTDGRPRGALGERADATSVTVVDVGAFGLAVRARHLLAPPAVFAGVMAVLAPLGGRGAALLLTGGSPGQEGTLQVLAWREGGLALVAAAPGQPWAHLIGATDLTGNGGPEIVAVADPHQGGVLTAYRRRGAALAAVGRASGYASHAPGSRNLDQALVADFDGNGRPEVVVPRQSRDVLAGLELAGDRFVERWAVDLKSPVSSNLVAGDLDGDGLLDLAVADHRAVHVLLSARP
jgi:hypothetical protein